MLFIRSLINYRRQCSGYVRYTLLNMSHMRDIQTWSLCDQDNRCNEPREDNALETSTRLVFGSSSGLTTCLPAQDSHLSTRSSFTELHQHRLDISDTPGPIKQTLPAIHLGVPYQSTCAGTGTSQLNVREATKKLGSKQPSGTQYQGGSDIDSHQNWLGRSSPPLLRSALHISNSIKKLVDECLPRSPIRNHLQDIRDEFVCSAFGIEFLTVQFERWSSLGNATGDTLPLQAEEIVAQFADSFGTRRDFLVFCVMEKDLQLSTSAIRHYFSLIERFCLRRHLARESQVTPGLIAQLYTRPDLLQFNDSFVVPDVRSSVYQQTIRSLHNLQLAVVGFVVLDEMPAINAEKNSDFKLSLRQVMRFPDRTMRRKSPVIASQKSKDPSRLAPDIVDTNQKGTCASPTATTASDDEVMSAAGGMPPSSTLVARNKQEQTRTYSKKHRMGKGRQGEEHYPEKEKSRRLSHSVRGSLYNLLSDFNGFIISPRSEFERRLSLSWFELERGGNEVSKLAHEARYWRRFREHWAELSHGQSTSKTSMIDMLTELHDLLHREIIFAFHRSWQTMSGHYFVLDRLQCFYGLMSRKEHHYRHTRVVLPMRETSASIRQLLSESFILNATPILLGQLTGSWAKLSSHFMGATVLRETPLTSTELMKRYVKCHNSFRDLRWSLRSLRMDAKKGSAASGSIIFGGPLRQYLVWEPPKEQQGGKTMPDNDSQQRPESGKRIKTQGRRDRPIRYLPDESNRTEQPGPSLGNRAQRPWPTHPVFKPLRVPSISLECTPVGRQGTAAFHTSTTTSRPSVPIATVANHPGPEKLQDTTSDDGSIARCEISSPFGPQMPLDRMREEMLAFTTSKSARSPCDQGEQYNKQRGNGIWDSRKNIVFGASQDQRAWQPSRGMHFSTSTSAPGWYQLPSKGSDNSTNAKPRPSAMLPREFPLRRRCISSSNVRIQPPCTRTTKHRKARGRRTAREPRDSRRSGNLERPYCHESVTERRFRDGCYSLCALARKAADHIHPQNPIGNRFWDVSDELLHSSRVIRKLLYQGRILAKPRMMLIGSRREVRHAYGREGYALRDPVIWLRHRIQLELQRTRSGIEQYCRLINRFVKRRGLEQGIDGIIDRVQCLFPNPDFLVYDDLFDDPKANTVLNASLQTQRSLLNLRSKIHSFVLIGIVRTKYHRMFSEEATGLHGSLTGFDVMVRSRVLASQKHGGRRPVEVFRMKESEQLPPRDLESMDGEDRSSSFNPDRPPRSWPSSPNVRPHLQSGGSYKGSKVVKSKAAAFHTSTQASGSSSAQNEEIATADGSRSDDVLGDDSNIDMHQLRGPLGYHIPSHLLASSSSPSAYWKYTLYKGPKGQKVKVHYCRSLETTERIARLFLDEPVIGFDIEWKPSATAKDGIRKNVALIQLASEERIALFHIARFSKDDDIESLVAPTFKAIMESSSITKVGVSVKGDCTRLRNHMNIDSHGLFELSHLYKLVKFSLTDVKKINRKLVALAKQVEEHLMLPMSKDESVRGSDWSDDLNYEQISCRFLDTLALTLHLMFYRRSIRLIRRLPTLPYLEQ